MSVIKPILKVSVMNEIDSIRKCIKDEINRVKDTLIRSKKSSAIRYFLDSIQDDIRFMLKEGFNYKQQVEIINRSSDKDVKYNTYIRYVKNHILNKNGNKKQTLSKDSGENKRFKHEAVPNVDELY